MDARDTAGLTLLQCAFNSERPTVNGETCTAILQYVPTDSAYIELLHGLLTNVLNTINARFSMKDFGVVLSQNQTQVYVNQPNVDGITLLQRAAWHLNCNAV